MSSREFDVRLRARRSVSCEKPLLISDGCSGGPCSGNRAPRGVCSARDLEHHLGSSATRLREKEAPRDVVPCLAVRAGEEVDV